MPRWLNQPLTLYHGTDSGSLPSWPVAVGSTLTFSVNLSRCRRLTDFGRGFYTTTNQHQARQWANTRVLRTPMLLGVKAVVLAFSIDRDVLSSLDTLAFVRSTTDYWDLVTDCRYGFNPHARAKVGHLAYDIVYGPVTIWPQSLVIADCDQISFHTSKAAAALGLPILQAEAAVDLFP